MTSESLMQEPSSKVPFPTSTRIDPGEKRVQGVLLLFLALWAVAKLYQSDVAVPWMDERFSYFADQSATVRDVIKIQTTRPLALDPPLTHVIQHYSLRAGAGNLLIYRLPSFVFCFAMLSAVYLYLRRLGGVYLGAFAVAILLMREIIVGQFANARPYALLLGASGVALLFWQNCVRGRARRGSAIGLFLALGAGVASHFYGVLLPVPFLIAEAYRAWERRRLDVPVLAAILGSFTAALSWVACIKAVKQYRTHYYHTPGFSLSEVYRGFSTPFADTTTWNSAAHTGRLFLMKEHGAALVFFLILALGFYAGVKASAVSMTVHAEWVALGGVALVPVFGIVLSRIAVGTFEPRFTLEHSIGVAAALSSALLYFVRSREIRNGVLVLACIGVAAKEAIDIRGSLIRRAAVSTYIAQLNESSLGKGDLPVVFADYELYLLLQARYRDIAPFTAKMIWVYDLDRSVRWETTDTPDRTIMNLGHFTGFPIVSYDSFVQTNHRFRLFDVTPMGSGPSWLPNGILAEGGILKPVETINDASGLIGNQSIYDVQLPAIVK